PVANVPHLIVLGIGPDIYSPVMDSFLGRVHEGNEGTGDVATMNEGPPRRAIGHDANLSGGDGTGEEIVDHKVDAQHRRIPVGRGVSKIGGSEIMICKR